jgi:hypothetical protein
MRHPNYHRAFCPALVLGLAVACGGDIVTTRASEVPPQQVDTVGEPKCSESGLETTCDPVENTGCSEGFCYLLDFGTTGCRCTAGAIAKGGTCTRSVQCAPGTLCISLPGTPTEGLCLPICNPDATASSCTSPATCITSTNNAAIGYCGVR